MEYNIYKVAAIIYLGLNQEGWKKGGGGEREGNKGKGKGEYIFIFYSPSAAIKSTAIFSTTDYPERNW